MKKVLALILSIAILASLCVTAMADDTITLNFQMWSDEEELFTELIRLYEAEHPNVKINMTCTPSSDYTVKLQTVLGGGGDVDMFGISSPPGLAEYVNKGAVRPLDDLIAAAGTDLTGVQSILDSIAIDGKTYGLPYKTSSWFVGHLRRGWRSLSHRCVDLGRICGNRCQADQRRGRRQDLRLPELPAHLHVVARARQLHGRDQPPE